MTDAPDPAVEFRAMYLAHCEACRKAGIPVPTIDDWIARIEERIAEGMEPPDER